MPDELTPPAPDQPRIGVDEWVASVEEKRERYRGPIGLLRRGWDEAPPGVRLLVFVVPAAVFPFVTTEGNLFRYGLITLVYGLQAASLVVGVTLIAAVIINYLRRGQAAGTWLESHFTWQIRTFWWSLVWCILGVATAVLVVGFFVLFASAVWFVYRIVKGWTELNEGRPMYS